VNGERIVTDITANDGFWHSVCVMWHSSNGEWSIYIDAKLGDNGTGLANGTFIPGKEKALRIAYRESPFYFITLFFRLI
jgi:CUB/sushi domain-containing protein